MTQPELTSGFIRAENDDGVLHVTIDRASKRNSLTAAMYDDLSRCVAHAEADDAVRTLLIDSEGDMFCAGNDVAEFANASPETRKAGSAGPALSFIKQLRALDKPVVIAVQGQATGIGTTMLLHADFVIADERARFYTAFIDLALVPEAASSLLLPGLVGRQNAARLLLAGDTIDSEEALRMGLIAYRVADAALAHEAMKLAKRLAAKPPEAMRQSKQLLRQGLGSDDVDGQIEREAERFGERLFSDEVREIMNKFLQRKK
ncbi:enoyl-CoA hydratase/isomerase [Salinisphaera sp. T5B8]|uniref:enoyl-CoA hydratase-related protein n=1 Tax=unclassified Salinisphaera TaxID=2649847 RepID=UPI00333E878A